MLRSDAMRRFSDFTRKVAARGLLATAVVTVAAISAVAGTGAAGATGNSGSGSGKATLFAPVTIGIITDAGGSPSVCPTNRCIRP